MTQCAMVSVILNQYIVLGHSSVWLCDLVFCSPPGSSFQGTSQARTLEWVSISFATYSGTFLGRSSLPSDRISVSSCISCTADGFFTAEPPGKPINEDLFTENVAQSVKNPPRMRESACNAGDLVSIPGSGRSPGEGNGNPLQYSCLENPTDRGA